MELVILPVITIAIVITWWRDRTLLGAALQREAEAKRDHRLALAYIATRDGEASLFAGAFLGGHHQIITRHFADFHDFRGREIERELEIDTDE